VHLGEDVQQWLNVTYTGRCAPVRQTLWFQHDGAIVHYGEDVQQWLNATYPGKRIGG
jgi:hypothetical protein